jgi:DinB family protein
VDGPAEQIRAVPGAVRDVLAGAGDDDLRRRPAPGEWSAIEVLGHLIDKVAIWTQRSERILDEDEPFLPGYDQEALVREHAYQDAAPEELLARLTDAWDQFADVVESVPLDALEREGTHEERGQITLAECIRAPIDSIPGHLEQAGAALRNG